ncbi:hypothetical protein P9027_29745 [Bacillus thuringiensis]|uniref:hypothetical protein n=1 Tax=Bacillus thuringiensis TaxID=1428 RepID=UPI002DBBD436|nr:hypothetical protein [Bacillus thuringiensis]MEC3226104.1 hypothetical protein [Bacillus thuringiensis]MEC3463186.1 hypothetical protein [Bacillus thuringiensis]MEC3555385.1 hypothetical protein [Bacillus thuringiensis]MED2058870.1 hypothetical protein [Bacillus thuringiensis]
MSTQYHFDNIIFASWKDIKDAVDNHWYKKYNKYMIREFFYIGKKFVFEGIMYEVLNNSVQESQVEGWLYLKSIGESSYKAWISPRKILSGEPGLKEELDESLERANAPLDIIEDHVQMQLF